MRACAQLLFVGLLLAVVAHGRALPDEEWKSYRRAVQDVTVELAVPYGLVNKLGKAEWIVLYSAARLEEIYAGRAFQAGLFGAFIDIPGPFWVGRYGVIEFRGLVNKKPDWFRGDLFDIAALAKMMEHRVKVLGNGNEFQFDLVTINGEQWVHWFDYTGVEAPDAKTGFEHHDRYTRPLTDDLYLDVAIDLTKANAAENRKWLPEAEKLREKMKNSLVIRYPADTLKAPKPTEPGR